MQHDEPLQELLARDGKGGGFSSIEDAFSSEHLRDSGREPDASWLAADLLVAFKSLKARVARLTAGASLGPGGAIPIAIIQ